MATDMDETPHTAAHPGPDEQHVVEEFDREIQVKRILLVGFSIIGTTVVSMILMWFFAVGLKNYEIRQDPPPSPVPQANAPTPPPLPHLQPAPRPGQNTITVNPIDERPSDDLKALRRQEEQVLDHYAWVDRGAGIARIPIERAIDILAERGSPPGELPAIPGVSPSGTQPEGSGQPPADAPEPRGGAREKP